MELPWIQNPPDLIRKWELLPRVGDTEAEWFNTASRVIFATTAAYYYIHPKRSVVGLGAIALIGLLASNPRVVSGLIASESELENTDLLKVDKDDEKRQKTAAEYSDKKEKINEYRHSIAYRMSTNTREQIGRSQVIPSVLQERLGGRPFLQTPLLEHENIFEETGVGSAKFAGRRW